MVSDVRGKQLTKKIKNFTFFAISGIKFLRNKNRYMSLYFSVHIKQQEGEQEHK
jgi:hypothetical protein